MRTSLCLLVFAIGAVPLAAQPDRRAFPARDFPPDMISPDDLPRNIVRVAPAHVRVDFENDRTRVLRLTLGAGEAIPAHDDRADAEEHDEPQIGPGRPRQRDPPPARKQQQPRPDRPVEPEGSAWWGA